MGKKVKKKGKSPAKDKWISNHPSSKTVGESTNQTVQSANEVVSTVKKRKVCPHLEQGVNLEKLSIKIGSSDPIKCESCREGALDRRVTGGKGKQGKKGGASGDSKSESNAIWICLECGQYSCGGVELPVTPHCHVGRHARQDRHHLVVLFEKTLLCWCFPCNMLIPVEKLEEDGKGNNVLSEVVKLIKGQSLEISAVNAEDVWLGSGSENGVVSGASLTQDSFGREGYVVRGLVNLGNTCFFNCVVQNLLAMDSMRDGLLQINSDGALTSAFKKLINETYQQTDPKSIINPRTLFGSLCLKAPQFKGFQQQDSHELLRCLLDGLSTEELAMRKQMGASKEDTVASNGSTFVDILFGGQISSTVQCCECGHSSTVYEPFLDLSLPVPTKKPASKKAQQVSRTKKAKLPPRKSGRIRSKVNKDVDHVTYDNLSSQSTRTESSRHVHPDLLVNGEKTELCGGSRLLGSTNTTSGVDEGVVNSSTSSSFQNSTQILENTEENLASFSWMDYLENGTESEENDLTSHSSDHSLILDVKKKDISAGECLAGAGTELSCQIVPNIPPAEVVSVSGCSTSRSCAENASKGAFVSKDNVSSQEMEGARINANNDEQTSSTFDNLLWLDDIEPTTVSEKSGIPPKNNYSLVPATERMGTTPEEVSGPGITESMGQNYLQNKDPILDLNSSSWNGWDEEVPLQIQGSQVLLLPYKEESSIDEDKIGGVGEASSSNLGWGRDEAEFEGIGDLFNEPEVVAGPSNKPCCSSEIAESGFLAGHCGESDQDEVDDTDSPVSVESCLNFFVKPELLSNENALHCENCAKVLLHKKLEAKQHRTLPSVMISGGTNSQCIENNTPTEARNISHRHIKSNIVEGSSNFSNGIIDCLVKNGVKLNGVKLRKCPTGDLDALEGHKENVKCEKRDSFIQEFQTPRLNEDCNTERCLDEAGVSCSLQPADKKGSRCTSQVLHQVNTESEDFEDEEVHCERVDVKRVATKSVFIHKAPSILTIHLKRFSQDARGRFSKLNGHVRFGESIDLRLYLDSRSLDEEKLHYRLVGVVEHLGSMRGGHYVAYVRGGRRSRGQAKKEVEGCVWYHASDIYVREVTLDEVLRSEAYILFYEKT